MGSVKSFLARVALLVCTAALIGGCAMANSYLMKKSVTSGDFKLTNVKVVWITPPSYTLVRHARISVDAAEADLAGLQNLFREKAASRIQSELAARGVPSGNQFTLSLTTTTVHWSQVGARVLVIDAAIHDNSGTRAVLTMNATGTSAMEIQGVLDIYVKNLVAQIALAGWLPAQQLKS